MWISDFVYDAETHDLSIERTSAAMRSLPDTCDGQVSRLGQPVDKKMVAMNDNAPRRSCNPALRSFNSALYLHSFNAAL